MTYKTRKRLHHITVCNTDKNRFAMVRILMPSDATDYYQKLFSFSEWGVLGAIRAAIRHRDETGPKIWGEVWDVCVMNYPDHMNKPNLNLSCNNTSGEIGVSIMHLNKLTKTGKRVLYRCVAAQYRIGPVGNRKTVTRQWSIAKYGQDEAVRLASEWRAKQLANSHL